MKTNRGTIAKVLAMMSAAYPGKVEITQEIALLWLDILRDMEETSVIEAVRDLISAPGQFPPSVGDVRHRATELSMGLLAPPSAIEAWERVTGYAMGEVIHLSEDEARALKFVGGTWAVTHTSNPETVRSQFMRAYDEYTRRRILETRAHCSTRALVESNRPALPDLPDRKTERLTEHRTATPEQVREFLKGYRCYGEEFND